VPEPPERAGQGAAHPGAAGPALRGAVHQTGRGHQGLHLQGTSVFVLRYISLRSSGTRPQLPRTIGCRHGNTGTMSWFQPDWLG